MPNNLFILFLHTINDTIGTKWFLSLIPAKVIFNTLIAIKGKKKRKTNIVKRKYTNFLCMCWKILGLLEIPCM